MEDEAETNDVELIDVDLELENMETDEIMEDSEQTQGTIPTSGSFSSIVQSVAAFSPLRYVLPPKPNKHQIW